MQCSIIEGWAWWALKIVFGRWLVATAVLVLVLEIGSNILEYLTEETVARVSSGSFRALESIAANIDKMYKTGQLMYLSVPLGLVGGMVFAVRRGSVGQAGLAYCLQAMIVLASLALAAEVVYTFARLCQSMFSRTSPVTAPDQDTKDFEAAALITDLRKVYLYEALHDIILLAIVVAIALNLRGVPIASNWPIATVVILLVSVYLFNQLPYTIGQSSMHRDILRGYSESKRAELIKKFSESAPVWPSSKFIAAQFSGGTVGTLVYGLLNELLKAKLKTP